MNLKPFEAGKPLLEQLTATRMNAIVAAVNAGEVMSGVGVRVSKTPGGTTISTCPTPRERRGNSSALTNSHPWKATANGDATVYVAPGKVLGHETENAPTGLPSYIHLKKLSFYAGGNITITDNGKIYGSVTIDRQYPCFRIAPFVNAYGQIDIGRYVAAGMDSVSVEFATALPTSSNKFYFEIADVTLADEVATVIDQIMTHNPTLESYYLDASGV